jgi:uncharacterized membrane protein YecN with MAPEG domain
MSTTLPLPTVTMVYAAVLAILLVLLALNVVRLRLGRHVGLGIGNDGALEQPVRVHANFAENAPMFVVLLLLAELAGLKATWLHAAGSIFVVSRLLHAFGLSTHRGRSPGRFLGSAGSWTTVLALSGYLLARSLG